MTVNTTAGSRKDAKAQSRNGTGKQPALLPQLPVGDFLAARLENEVGLAKSDDFFAWVGILKDEVAGIAGVQDGPDGPLSAFANGDHFGDINEMILDALAIDVPDFSGFATLREPSSSSPP